MVNNAYVEECISILRQGCVNAEIHDQVIGKILKVPDGLDLLIPFINEQMKHPMTVNHGLFLINTVLPECNKAIVQENIDFWLSCALKNCKSEAGPIAFDILSYLIKCDKSIEGNSIVQSNVNKIIEQITVNTAESSLSKFALECLENLLQFVAGSCGSHTSTLEKYCLSYIDMSFTFGTPRTVGKCLTSLQRAGGGGNLGLTHKANWKKLQIALCSTFHQLMDTFLEGVNELNNYSDDQPKPLTLPQFSEPDLIKSVANRIINITIFLEEMFLTPFPTFKQIMPTLIIKVLTRGLTLNQSVFSSRVITDMIKSSSYLCLIQTELLQLMQAFILSLGRNLIPFSGIISKLLHNILTTIPSSETSFQSHCELKNSAYQTCTMWVETTKGACGLDVFMNKLFPVFIEDISPVEVYLFLTITNTVIKHINKKSLQTLKESNANSSRGKRRVHKNAAEFKVCFEALRTINSILTNANYIMQPLMHKELLEIVLKILSHIQIGTIEDPYKDSNCQIELYKVLASLVINHHYNMVAPLDSAINLLSKGQNHSNYQISSTCTTAIASINCIMHPMFGSLRFHKDDDTSKTSKKKDVPELLQDTMLELLEKEVILETNNIDLAIQNEVIAELRNTPLEIDREFDGLTEYDVQHNLVPKVHPNIDLRTYESETGSPQYDNNEPPAPFDDPEIINIVEDDEDEIEVAAPANEEGRIESNADDVEMCNSFVDLVNE